MLVAYSYFIVIYLLSQAYPCNKMNVTGFLFGCKYMMIFSKVLQKSDGNLVKQNANVCIAVQSVWEHKTCEYGISA